MSVDREKLNALLKWFMNVVSNIDAIVVVDREGLTIASESNTKIDEDIIGGVSAIVEQVLQRINTEFKSGKFGTGSFDTETNRLIFVEAGPQAVLVTIATSLASIDELYPYVYILAEKIARVLDGRPVSPVIPEIVPCSSGTTTEQGQLVKIDVPSGAYAYKIVLAGEGAVGKTSLVHSFVEGTFQADYKATIGTSIMKKEFAIKGSETTVRFVIWDLAGQDQFKRVRKQYFREAEAAVIVFDLTRRETFEMVEEWINEAKQGGKEDIKIILVGNKMDLPDRQVSFEEGAELGKRLGYSYIETSAKTGEMVSDTFEMLALTLFKGLTTTSLG